MCMWCGDVIQGQYALPKSSGMVVFTAPRSSLMQRSIGVYGGKKPRAVCSAAVKVLTPLVLPSARAFAVATYIERSTWLFSSLHNLLDSKSFKCEIFKAKLLLGHFHQPRVTHEMRTSIYLHIFNVGLIVHHP